jgi:hypothetical protein
LTDIAWLHPSFGVSPSVIDAAGRLPVDGHPVLFAHQYPEVV